MSFIAVGAGAGYLIGGTAAAGAIGMTAAGGAIGGALLGSAIGHATSGGASAPQIDPQQVGQNSLATQLALAPQVLQANQLYGPQYTDLQLQNTQHSLFGNFDAGAFEAAHPGFMQSFQQQQAAGELQGWTPQMFAAAYTGVAANDPSLSQYMNGGLLSIYGSAQPALSDLSASSNTAQRTADINDVAALGPAARAAYLAANPQLASAMQHLDQQVAAAQNVTPTQLNTAYAPPTTAPTAATAAAPGALSATNAPAPGSLATTYAANPGTLNSVSAAAPGAITANLASNPGRLDAIYAANPGTLNAAYAQAPTSYNATTAGPTSLTPRLLSDAANYSDRSQLQQSLEQQAMHELGLNGQLSAEDIRDAQQSARGAAEARGIYDSNSALSAEVLNTAAMRRQRQQEARAFASSVDASGQAQLNAGRSFATGVEGQQQNVNMFNAGQTNSVASQIYGTNANINLANAAAENAARSTTYSTQANTNLANAAAGNNAAATTYGTNANVNMFNAGQGNSIASQMYGTQANVNLANAAAANSAANTTYGANTNVSLANAAAANNAATTAYGANVSTNLANAAATNNAAATTYGTNANVNMFNAGQGNSLASQAYSQANQNAQFGAQFGAQQQLNQSQLNSSALNTQIAQQFQLANTYQGQATDPFAVVLGRSGVPGQVAGTVGQGAAMASNGPALFNPFNPSITSIYAGNQANQTAANIAAGNNNAAMTGSLLQMGGNVAAAYMGCWVARAAFGPQNPRWLAAQRWLVMRAPRSLFLTYHQFGPMLAEQLVADGRRDYFRSLFRRLIRNQAGAIIELTNELNACAPAKRAA